jgi:large subunit ribosomal protein L3
MAKAHNPRRGSMQFWPRKRSKHSFVRVRSWAEESKPKPLAFVAFKAGMTHVMVVDNRSKSATKGEKISLPVTIFDCPPMLVMGATYYKKTNVGNKKVATSLVSEISKDMKKFLSRSISLPSKKIPLQTSTDSFDFMRLLVATNPSKTTTGAKKSQLIEIALGSSKEDQLAFVKEHFGKEIKLDQVFESGAMVDARAVTRGKGFQGVVKRYGVSMVSHKSEKGQRKVANMGAWTPKRVDYRVAQPGKMGYHQRTEYNKQIILQGEEVDKVNRLGGIPHYGLIKNQFVLIKGSVAGPAKAPVLLTQAIRRTKNSRVFSGAPEVTFISI